MVNGVEVSIITDGSSATSPSDAIGSMKVRSVADLKTAIVRKRELISVVEEEDPDILAAMVGTTSVLYARFFKHLRKPIVGVFTSPIYNLNDFTCLSFREIMANLSDLWNHLLGLIIPRTLIRVTLNSNIFSKVIVQSVMTKLRLIEIGVFPQKIVHIPPGINRFSGSDLTPQAREAIERVVDTARTKEEFTILYYGSPLTIRGIDTVVQAFEFFHRKQPRSRLVILSRLERPQLASKEAALREALKRNNLEDSVTLHSGFLKREKILSELLAADVVVLPFKFVVSDVPLSVLDTLSLGIPLISTRVDGIPEFLEKCGLIVNPNRPKELSRMICRIYSDERLRKSLKRNMRLFREHHPSWGAASKHFKEVLSSVLREEF